MRLYAYSPRAHSVVVGGQERLGVWGVYTSHNIMISMKFVNQRLPIGALEDLEHIDNTALSGDDTNDLAFETEQVSATHRDEIAISPQALQHRYPAASPRMLTRAQAHQTLKAHRPAASRAAYWKFAGL